MKKELEKLLSHKRNLNLQLFAEEGGDGESGNDDPEIVEMMTKNTLTKM